MGAHVRAATHRDLPQLALMGAMLARLHHEVDPARFMFGGDSTGGYRAWFHKEMSRPETCIGVSDAGTGELTGYVYGRLTGTGWATLFRERAVLIDIFVHDSARKSGVGEALVRSFCTWASLEGARRVVLMTASTKSASFALFGKFGLRQLVSGMMRDA